MNPISTVEPGVKPRSRRLGVGSLMVVVGCAALLLWSVQSIVEQTIPVRGWAKQLGSSSASVDERVKAAWELGNVREGFSVVTPALLGALDDPNAKVRAVAVRSLNRTSHLALAATDPLARLVEKALIRAMDDSDSDVATRATDGVYGLRYRLVSTPSMADTDFEVDDAAIQKALTRQLGSSNEAVRIQAARAFGMFGPTKGVGIPSVLIEAFMTDPSFSVRLAAADSLVNFREKHADRVMLLLIEGVKQDDPRVREFCVRRFDSPRLSNAVIPNLIELLNYPDNQVRYHALRLLHAFGPAAAPAFPMAAAILNESYSKDDENPKNMAANMIKDFASDLDEATIQQALDGLGLMLDHPRDDVRLNALLTIRHLKESSFRMISKLEAIQKDDPDARVRAEAALSIDTLNDLKDRRDRGLKPDSLDDQAEPLPEVPK